MRRAHLTHVLAASFAVILASLVLSGCTLLDLIPHTIGNGLQPRSVETAEPLTELDSETETEIVTPPIEESPIIASGVIDLPRSKAEYTVLVYMVGSDLESSHGYASNDLQEMLSSEVDVSRINIVAFTGGSQSWRANIPNDRNCVLDLGSGKGAVAGATDRSLDMGAPETLTSFLTWACENYPADHTALILWNHGGGPAEGYGYDQIYRNDHLSLAEMDKAMAEAGFGEDRKLDWVGFDACLMGSLEVMQAFRPYTDYLVASEDEEPGAGWNYVFLKTLNDTSDTREITCSIVDAYESFFQTLSNANSQPNITLSAVDLTKLDPIVEALDGLSGVTLTDFESGRFSSIAQARSRCRSFGSASPTAPTIGSPLVDLVDLAERVSSRHPEEASAIKAAVAEAVIRSATNLSGAHGISLYFPIANISPDVTSPSEHYGRMLGEYSTQGQEANQVDWTFPEVTLSDDTYTATLNSSQSRSLASVNYSIFFEYNGKGYVPIISNIQVEPDQQGSIRLPKDPLIIVSASDGISPIRLTQTDGSADRQVYQSRGTYLEPGAEFVDAINDSVEVSLSLALDPQSEEVSIAGASLTDSETPSSSRSTIDLSHYKSLACYMGGWQYPDRDESGAMLPYASWSSLSGNMIWFETALDDELSFLAKHVSEVDGTFVMQVVLTDVNGNRHASELIPLEGLQAETTTVKTDNGTLTFLLEKDHAELLGYKGSDTSLTIPSQVDGRTVTAVAGNALSNDWTIEELVLPDSITSIGIDSLRCHKLRKLVLGSGLERIEMGALARCDNLTTLELPKGLKAIGRGALRELGVETIALPSTLEELGTGALTGCKNLTSYEVGNGCTAATATDGVLFSADGSVLIAFPAGRTGSYAAPTGTKVIGYGAFVSTKLESVTLPEGLTAIDNCAFYDGSFTSETQLASIELPSSLQSVGSFAFGMTYRRYGFDEQPRIEVIKLGRNLEYVGNNAFTGLNLSAFVVDEANPYYASPAGLLTNKAADTVLEVPSGLGQVVVVPDGITTVGKNTFYHFPAGTDFILPASLSRISVLAFPYHYDGISDDANTSRVYDARFHCGEGTASAQFAEKHHIEWDTITDPKVLSAERMDVTQGDLTLGFLVYGDHAALLALDGSADADTRLVIPDEVGGVPVTQISNLSTSTCYVSAWKSVTLPAALESIDYEAIPRLRSEEGFSLADENKTFVVRDGTLFSADGTTLVAFSKARPLDAEDEVFSYEVPMGTRTIARGAFYESSLEQVSLPSTLRIVRSKAFASNYYLSDIRIAKGLERIEDSAFRCPATSIELPSSLTHLGDNALILDGYEGLVLPNKLKSIGDFAFKSGDVLLSIGSDTLRIGSKLSHLGQASLAGFDVNVFEVDESNKYFAAVDGLLTTKNGKDLLCCPSGKAGELHIPEGIRHLMPGCLDKATGITDVYFPDSVIGLDPYYGSNAAGRQVTFHCKAGSAAALYAQEHDIVWTEEGL